MELLIYFLKQRILQYLGKVNCEIMPDKKVFSCLCRTDAEVMIQRCMGRHNGKCSFRAFFMS